MESLALGANGMPAAAPSAAPPAYSVAATEVRAPRAPRAPKIAERRYDKGDGRAYTRQEFINDYGGTEEWEAAMPEVVVEGREMGQPHAAMESIQEAGDAASAIATWSHRGRGERPAGLSTAAEAFINRVLETSAPGEGGRQLATAVDAAMEPGDAVCPPGSLAQITSAFLEDVDRALSAAAAAEEAANLALGDNDIVSPPVLPPQDPDKRAKMKRKKERKQRQQQQQQQLKQSQSCSQQQQQQQQQQLKQSQAYSQQQQQPPPSPPPPPPSPPPSAQQRHQTTSRQCAAEATRLVGPAASDGTDAPINVRMTLGTIRALLATPPGPGVHDTEMHLRTSQDDAQLAAVIAAGSCDRTVTTTPSRDSHCCVPSMGPSSTTTILG